MPVFSTKKPFLPVFTTPAGIKKCGIFSNRCDVLVLSLNTLYVHRHVLIYKFVVIQIYLVTFLFLVCAQSPVKIANIASTYHCRYKYLQKPLVTVFHIKPTITILITRTFFFFGNVINMQYIHRCSFKRPKQ